MNFLLKLLNVTIFIVENWQLRELNSIIAPAQNRSEILTLALFGQFHKIEPYIRVLEENNTPKLVITRSYGDINFNQESGLNKEVFFIAVASLEHKELWNYMNKAFMGVQGHVRGVFITNRSQKENFDINLKQHFEWCWRKGFTSTLVLVDNENIAEQKYEIYSYNHFLQRKVLNMTHLSKTELYPDKFRNLHKFKIRTAALFDPPRVFEKGTCWVKYNKRLLGYVATLFEAFLKEYNAEMDLLYFARNKSFNIMEIIARIENDEIDVGINPYIPFKNAHLSYPLRMVQRCVVVPYPEELSKYKYFIMPFEIKVWLSFLATWFVLSLAKLFGWFIKYKKCCNATTDMGQVCLQVWRLLMYLPAFKTCHYKDFKWFNAVWFSFIATMGFIVSNLYLASLTSYFSSLTFKPLINTVAELIARRIIVDAVDYEIPAIINNRDLPQGFAQLLRARNASELLTEILALASNHSYTDLEDRIQFALNQQAHLYKPISQMVKECLTTMPLGFLMPPHSQFEKPLNRFILRSSSVGLIDKWILDSLQDGYCSGVLNMRMPSLEIARPLTLKHFQFGWFVLGAGYAVGTVCFLLENFKRILKRFRIVVLCY